MKTFIKNSLLLFFILLLSSCSSPRRIIPEEVLQLPEYAKVYTSYNLWAQEDEEKKGTFVIDELNIQKGELIPFGTEITFMQSDMEKIVFKRQNDGKIFILKYSAAKNIRNIEDVIKSVFTTKLPEELAAGIRKKDLEKLKRGMVEKGMRRSEVLLGYGLPPPLRTQSLTVDTWTYFTDHGVTRKIVFFGDRVTEIIQLD